MSYELTVYNGEVVVEDLGFFGELQKVILDTQEIDAKHNREIEDAIRVLSDTEKDVSNIHVLREIKSTEDRLVNLGLTLRLLVQEMTDLEFGIATTDLAPLIDSETDESRAERRKAEREGKKVARKLLQSCHPDNTDDFLLHELFQPAKEAFDAHDWDQIDALKTHYDLIVEARRDRFRHRQLKQELLRRAYGKKDEAVQRLIHQKTTAGGVILDSYRKGQIVLAIKQTHQLLKFQKGKVDEAVIDRMKEIERVKLRIKEAKVRRAASEPVEDFQPHKPMVGYQWESS